MTSKLIGDTVHLEFEARIGHYFSLTQYNANATVIDIDSLTEAECNDFITILEERKAQIAAGKKP